MKSTLFRGFGIACFLIGMISFVMDNNSTFINTTNQKNITKIENLQKQLADANKHIQQLEKQLEESKVKNENTTKNSSNKEIDDDSNVVKGTLYIYSGSSIYDISSKLKEMGIIKNSVEMELFLAQPEYSKYLQIGQFEVDSTMSIEEIANLITGKAKKE